MSVFEVVGVGVILPFLSVVSDPTLAETHPLLRSFCDLLQLDTPRERMIGVGVAAFLVITLGMGVRAYVTYLQFRFALMRSYSLASRLLYGYLAQDWVWHLSRNSADFGTTILSEIDQVVRESILPTVLMVSNGLVVAMLAALVFVTAPVVAMAATGVLVLVYALISLTLRSRLVRVGQARMAANRRRFLAVQEITGGLKDLKVLGLEQQSLRRFREPAATFARAQADGQIIGRLPRFAIEGTVFGGFILSVLATALWRQDGVGDLLPLFGLLAMAATRLFPSMQNIYQYSSQIRISAPALDRLLASLNEAARAPAPVPPAPPLPLRHQVEFKDVAFSYPGAERPTLPGLSLAIGARSTVGLVGGTGAGKTTVVDLLLGLLRPDSGAITVDGVPLGPAQIRAWQGNVGYVPQTIFLLDDSVAANIAYGFGVEPDMAAVERAARIAHLHDFIVSELPEGYATRVGERGIRLSGGQRQRIGIARALYRNPDVLIFDEATSALDTVTEHAVMEAVGELAGTKTLVMIAHRLSTVRHCDLIILLEGGHIVAQGSYDELIADSDQFRRMASI